MYRLDPPRRDAWSDFEAMILRRSLQNQQILEGAKERVREAYSSYDSLYCSAKPEIGVAFSEEEKKALLGNYSLLSAGKPFENIRLEILGAARHRRCPTCGVGQADTLDHYLPKTVYHEYSVLLKNLVPVCGYCNKKKLDAIPGSSELRYFHPYFDILPDVPLLVADVTVDAAAVAVGFRIGERQDVDPGIMQVLKFHFSELDLSSRFQAEATSEIFDRLVAFYLTYTYQDGARGLRRQLTIDATSARSERGPNDWKVALYYALARSAAFCEGGFIALLPPELAIDFDVDL